MSHTHALAVLIVLVASPAAAAERKQPFRVDDVYRFDAVTDLVVASGGQQAVYVREWAQRGWSTTRRALWRVAGSAERREPLEPDGLDAWRPVYSPDAKWIAFLSSRPFPDGTAAFRPVPPYSDTAGDIWLIAASGGQAIPLAGPGKPYGRVIHDGFYGGLAFSPDGKRLAFVADDGADPRSPAEVQRRITVVREDQGEGYEGYGPMQVWVAELALDRPGPVAAGQVRRLTRDPDWPAVRDEAVRMLSAMIKIDTSNPPGNETKAAQAKVGVRSLLLDSMLRTSLSPTIIQGGFRTNVIPGVAEATIDVRALPGEDIDALVATVRKLIDDPAVEVIGPAGGRSLLPPSRTDSAMFRALEHAQEAVFPGAITVPVLLSGATDMTPLRAKGVQAYGLGNIATIDDVGRVHGNDERASVEGLGKFVELVYRAVSEVAVGGS